MSVRTVGLDLAKQVFLSIGVEIWLWRELGADRRPFHAGWAIRARRRSIFPRPWHCHGNGQQPRQKQARDDFKPEAQLPRATAPWRRLGTASGFCGR